jgi:hypothetical protein
MLLFLLIMKTLVNSMIQLTAPKIHPLSITEPLAGCTPSGRRLSRRLKLSLPKSTFDRTRVETAQQLVIGGNLQQFTITSGTIIIHINPSDGKLL